MSDRYDGRDPYNPWVWCSCGHMWMRHDVNEYSGDGTETCCVEGCDQRGCPGRAAPREATDAA